MTFEIEGVDDRVIISTGDLDDGETITVRIEDVDIPDDVSLTLHSSRLVRRPEELQPILLVVDYEPIAVANITGGAIRTINGSGMMAVEPANVEQGSRNVDFTLTFTAATDFTELDLKIELPNVFDTELQGKDRSGDGYVTSSDTAKLKESERAKHLVVDSNTITWIALTLSEGRTFTTTIKDMDLLEETGDFRWGVTLGAIPINEKENPPMVVVGTTEDDVVFEIVEDGSSVFDP